MKGRIAALLALGALLAVAVTPARAAESHPLLGELIVGEGGVHTPDGHLEDACGLARDSFGATYVSDYYHDAIDIFSSPTGGYLTQIPEVSGADGPCGLAVDGLGNLYAIDWRADVVRFTPSSYPVSAATTYGPPSTIDASGTATGLAIDPSSGDIYVDDSTYVAQREPSGALIATIGEDPSAEYFGLAISGFSGTREDLYLADAATGSVKVLGPLGESLPSIDGAGTPQGGFTDLEDSALGVDPSDGHLFLADQIGHDLSEHPQMAIDEFNPAGEYRSQISRWITHPLTEPGVSIEHSLLDPQPPGLVIASGGYVYVTSENSDASESGALDREGRPLEGSVLYRFGATAAARRLAVLKTGSGGGTVTSSPPGIACGSACAAEYDEGTKVTLTAAPDSHSAFKGWSGACAGTAPTCSLTMSAARELGAEFEALPQRTLEVALGGAGEGSVTSSPPGIQCSSGTCAETFNQGSTVILTETPAPHSRFTGWGIPCDESISTTCEVTMNGNQTASAGFAPIPQQTLALSVSGEGSVTSQPAGIACPPSCSEHFDAEGSGSHVLLSAHPALHQRVAWSGCESQPGPQECEVSLSEARSLSAVFAPIPRTLSVTVLGSGQVSADRGALSGCGASGTGCSATYGDGEDVTLTATPAPGWSFAGWSGGACAGTRPCLVTLSADTAVSANFAPLPILEAPSHATLSLGRLSVRGARAKLHVEVSGPGTLLASGAKLKRTHLRAAAAGVLTLRLRLDAAGRRALARGRALSVPLTVTFAPAEGGPSLIAKRIVTFGGH